MVCYCLLRGHPLLRLPFPRGGYQFVFLQTVACSFFLFSKPAAAEKILRYSVFQNQQQASIIHSPAEKLLCYSVLKPKQQPSSKPAAAEKILCYSVFKNKQRIRSKRTTAKERLCYTV
jgi:hypothetical protein